MGYLKEGQHSDPSGVAVIGMSVRAPGADSLSEFWDRLSSGVEAIQTVSVAELLDEGVPRAIFEQPSYVPRAAPLRDPWGFDAGRFGITPFEARLRSPEHRILLELSVEALEDAACDPSNLPGKVGVFVGGGDQFTQRQDVAESVEGREADDIAIQVSNANDYLAAFISYQLNLTGPSVNVQTACSTSLSAVHLACQSIRAGECDVALAGGVSVRVPHRVGYLPEDEGIMSRDGRCRPFETTASGTVFGSGAGVVVLKSLRAALGDGDPIRAVLRGSAINNDGHQKLGPTAPSFEGQVAVIRAALRHAGTLPEEVTYIEAHGTGTNLGDAVELAALREVFGHSRRRIWLGCLKAIFGHTSSAAGILGLAKVILALERGIVPRARQSSDDPLEPATTSPFRLPETAIHLHRREGKPLQAAVSSFGLGGANAHVVVQKADRPDMRTVRRRKPQLLLLSASTESALVQSCERLADALRSGESGTNLADIAHTLQSGRAHQRYRASVGATTVSDAVVHLETLATQRRGFQCTTATEPLTVFMFPGQGSEHRGMFDALYIESPIFRKHVDECNALAREYGRQGANGLGLPQMAMKRYGGRASTTAVQAGLFAVEYALAMLLIDLGIRPDALVGYSLGEIVAATVGGVFPLDAAMRFILARGTALDGAPDGAMIAVGASSDRIERYLGEGTSIAAINNADVTVVAGGVQAIERLELSLAHDRIASRRLPVDKAFHTPLMEEVSQGVAPSLDASLLRPSEINLVSTVTGEPLTPNQATQCEYWIRQISAPVCFQAATEHLLRAGASLFVEVGPSNTLCAALGKEAKRSGATVVTAGSRTSPASHSIDHLLNALGRAWGAGVKVDWSKLSSAPQRKIHLPTYPFEHAEYRLQAEAKVMPASSVDGIRGWCHEPEWTPTARLSPSRWSAPTNGTVLIFSDRSRLGSLLEASLGEDGWRCVVVPPIEGANPATDLVGACDDLMQDLSGRIAGPLAVVDVTQYSRVQAASTAYARHTLAMSLALAGAIARNVVGPTSVLTVTSEVCMVAPGDVVVPEKALLLGPLHVLPREHVSVHVKHVDVGALTVDQDAARLSELLRLELRDLQASRNATTTIAFRNDERFELRSRPVAWNDLSDDKRLLRDRGVYLVTGGFGGIGSALAAHLARRVQAKLVLMGRRVDPAESPELGTGNNEVLERRRRITSRLEKEGSEVLVVEGDVGNSNDVLAAIEKGSERFGHIDGVIHAAGIPSGRVLANITGDPAWSALSAKVDGIQNLSRAFENRALDLFVVCSSMALHRGTPGQAEYCAANAYVEAWASSQWSQRERVIAIAWDSWEDVGMWVEQPSSSQYGRLQGRSTLRRLNGPYLSRLLQRSDGSFVGFGRVMARSQLLDGPALVRSVEMLRIDIEVLQEYLGAAVAGSGSALHVRSLQLNQIAWSPLEAEREVALTLKPQGNELWSCRIAHKVPRGGWRAVAEGVVDLSGRTAEWLSDAYENPQRHQLAFHHQARVDLSSPVSVICQSISQTLMDRGPSDAVRLRGAGDFVICGENPQGLKGSCDVRASDGTGGMSLDVRVTGPEDAFVAGIRDLTLCRDAMQTLEDDSKTLRSVIGDAPGVYADEGSAIFEMAIEGTRSHLMHVYRPFFDNRHNQVTTGHATERPPSPLGATFDISEGGVVAAMAELWEDLLGVSGTDGGNDFFELGGDSLLGMQLISRIRNKFGVKVSLRRLFETPTIAGLSDAVQAARGGGKRAIREVSVPTGESSDQSREYQPPALHFEVDDVDE